jgi:hypothetical protein
MLWALFLLIFNFNTMSWNYADINGALVFKTQEECIKPMTMYNEVLQNDKYVFVCEPYTGAGITEEEEEPLTPTPNNGEDKLKDMLDQYKDDTLNKPDTKGTGNNIFKGLGIREPYGIDI